MGDINWRFMDNGYGREYGLGTGDMETFLKHPLESLAREICQNSIDAQNKKGAVRVEFKRFEIVDVNKYPWHEGLKEEINRCYEYKKDSKKEGNALRLMKTIVEQPTLKCLRISDFNTTGLKGIENNKDDDTPYYNLAKGSGVSEKTGSEGGSKGIGKFASFVTSGINTVFYATKTVDNIDGYIGIANLRSRPIDNQEGLKTTGVGYFGSDQKNDPILGEVQLDDSFHRKAEEYGTDVYILGFKERKNWENTIIAKILESFMAAILYDYLQVNVDGVIVDKTTIQEIINNNDFSSGLGKRLYRDIKAQYELLSGGEGIYTKDFFVNENKISMFVKRHTSSNEKEATKQCVLIRYPYMKITYTSTSAYIPYSAVCVIHDGKLAQDLKLIENPQHTAWEIKRLDDDPDKKREIKNEDKELNNIITDYIKEVLNKSMSAKTDVEGAGEFLPAIDTGDELGGENNQNAQGTKFEISTPKINLPSKAKTLKINNNGKENDFAGGDEGEEEEGRLMDGGNGDLPSPNPDPKPIPKDEEEIGKGEKTALLKKALGGMKFRNIVIDKEKNKYHLMFVSSYTEDNCELEIKLRGAMNETYPVHITAASIDGNGCMIKEGKIVGMKLNKGKKYCVEYQVDNKNTFASEVIMSANR